ncbi:MAG: FAD-dependent monooxygenase [Bacteroidetes bacterium]|nr:FAD-dependent monooxygenase [Bacteroidota bacterium]
MQKTDYDIGIIGGGLAGLSLALLGAKAGYSVVLFEKEKYPFHKVCGEYISLESFDFLMKMGLPLKDWDLPMIKKLEVSDMKGKQYHFPLDMGGFGISRFTIDNELYELSKKNGVQVFENEKVNDVKFEQDAHILQTDKKTITAKIVAGAYGKRSNLDVKWKRSFTEKKAGKLNNFLALKYHIHADYPKDKIALHNFKNGYCGISAIDDDKYCLCYLTIAGNLSANSNSIQQMQENVLFQNPVIKQIFAEAEFLYDAPLAISQISFEQKTQIEDHVLCIGDAAGLITPLCGNGMSMAMHGARLAFDEINLFLQQKITRKEMEANYCRSWKGNFAARLTAGRIVQRLMGNRFSTEIFLQLMKSLPFLSAKLIRSTHGKTF